MIDLRDNERPIFSFLSLVVNLLFTCSSGPEALYFFYPEPEEMFQTGADFRHRHSQDTSDWAWHRVSYFHSIFLPL